MPNVGSWNGKWTTRDQVHTVLVGSTKKDYELIGSYRYDFGDGWSAQIKIREAEPKERISGKFYGYEWMVHSIRKHGQIIMEKK